MALPVEAPAYPFVENYSASLPHRIEYQSLPGVRIPARSTDGYNNARIYLMNHFLAGESSEHMRMMEGIAVEKFVGMAINPALSLAGFKADLAPMSLEHGNKQKGVDLLITDQEGLIYMGIDVKLARGTLAPSAGEQISDGHGWSEQLKSPYLYLKLGEWSLDHDTEEPVKVRQWMKDFTAPSLKSGEQIPHLNDFRRFLFNKIDRNINGFKEDLHTPEIYPKIGDIPNAGPDLRILRNKLALMQELFSTIVMNT